MLAHCAIGHASHRPRHCLFLLHFSARAGCKSHALPGKAKNDPEQQEVAQQELHIGAEMLLGGLNVNSGCRGRPLHFTQWNRSAFLTTVKEDSAIAEVSGQCDFSGTGEVTDASGT